MAYTAGSPIIKVEEWCHIGGTSLAMRGFHAPKQRVTALKLFYVIACNLSRNFCAFFDWSSRRSAASPEEGDRFCKRGGGGVACGGLEGQRESRSARQRAISCHDVIAGQPARICG